MAMEATLTEMRSNLLRDIAPLVVRGQAQPIAGVGGHAIDPEVSFHRIAQVLPPNNKTRPLS